VHVLVRALILSVHVISATALKMPGFKLRFVSHGCDHCAKGKRKDADT